MQFHEEEEYTKQFDFSLWKKLILYARPFYKYLVVIAVSMMITARVDVGYTEMTQYAIDNFVSKGQIEQLWRFVAQYMLMMILQVGSIFTFIRYAGKVEIGMCRRMRQLCFERLQEQPFAYYDKTPVGYLMARMVADIQRLGDTVGWGLIDLLWGGAYLVFVAVRMFQLNVWISLSVLTVVPVLAVVSVYFQRKILASYRSVRKLNSKITASFNEGIMGAKTTKTLVREEANTAEFRELAHSMRDASVRAAVLSALFMPIVMSLGSIASAYVLWRGGLDVSIGGMSFGVLTAFMTFTVTLFEPIREIARIFADLQSSQAAAERVISMLETEPGIQDTPEVVEKYGDAFHPKRENWESITGDISFENVSFQYKDGEKVLTDFSLEVKAGETIALVGETGSGKSTIVNLICRFYEPTEGRILIDGRDYKERSQLWLHSHLGYVLQQPHLFSGTIRDNIRYGKLEATDAEVEAAARLVDAEGFIQKLEKGYDTDVGEGGNRLSTGEKQLVSFARALLAEPIIFVLDEATSSVDTETEQRIQQAIQTALSGRTSFIIAHRLSTIRSADRILVIADGKVTEQGTHRQLIRQRGHYYELYTNQFKEELEAQILGKRRVEDAPAKA